MLIQLTSRSLPTYLLVALLCVSYPRVDALSQTREQREVVSQANIQSNQILSQEQARAEAMRLDEQANKLYEQGKFDAAIELAERARVLFERAFGPDHLELADLLKSLARLYRVKRDYARAELLLKRSLRIREQSLQPDHPDIAIELRALASIYDEERDYARAEPMYRRSLGIFERALGPDDPMVDDVLVRLAWLYFINDDFSRAEPVAQRLVSLRERKLGPNDPDTAGALSGLASLYAEKGDFARALPVLQRTLGIHERAFAQDHLQIGRLLVNLAMLYEYKGDYAEAETAAQRALRIFEKGLGPKHNDVGTPLLHLGGLYAAKGDIAQAVRFLSRANDILEHNIAPILATGSENHKRRHLENYAFFSNEIVSFHASSARNNLEAARLALTRVLRHKGRALDAMADQIGALRSRLAPQDRVLLDELSKVYSQIATLTIRESGQSDPLRYQAEVGRLEAKKDQLESEVGSRSMEFREQSLAVTLERVLRAIPKGAALVELVSYKPDELLRQPAIRKKQQEPRYMAYVLRREGEPTFVGLGVGAPINQAVTRLRASLADPERTDVKQAARALDELVMRPVRKLLGETRMVLLSPDSQLNLVPFAALVDEQGRYLVENYTFTYLTSGRDLLRLDAQAQSRQQPVVLANPTFDFGVTTDERNIAGPDVSKGRRSIDFKTLNLSPLTGTAQEAAAIKTIVPSAQMLTERRATEAALKHVAGPRFLHIATHGFFLKDQLVQIAHPARRITMPEVPQAIQGENPLLRSGLVLAGASKGQSGAGEDGVLTALEAAGLDLWGTKLVVLSACDTGVGQVLNGEGVYGLRRALVLAGAESQLMSLWQVSDRATRDLMIDYYGRLERGEGRTEALRAAQLQMLAGNKQGEQAAERRIGAPRTNVANYEHPYYWASFIPIGDWRPINKPSQGLNKASSATLKIPQPAINTKSVASEPAVEELTAMANVSYDKGDFAAAASFYQRSLALRPDNVEVRADLGNTYFYQPSPDYNAAIAEYRKALKIAPKDERVWYNLAVASLRKKSELTARDAFNQLAEINPAYAGLESLRLALASLVASGKPATQFEELRVLPFHR
jgi:CHAT domain-containing protein/Flp pilus assembly protein TadD